MRIIPLIVAAGAALSGCQTTAERDAARQAALVDVRPVGAPVDCVQTSRIRATHVRSDSTIDFEMTNGVVYRNTLTAACPHLMSEGRFAYRSTVGQLCSIDTVTVLPSAGIPGPTCGLGNFQKIEPAQ